MNPFGPFVLVIGLTAACAAAPAATPTVTAETPSVIVASPTPSPPAQAPAGSTQESVAEDSAVKVTLLRYRQPFTPTIADLIDRKGYEYGGIEVKLCLTRNNSSLQLSVSWDPWALSYEDGTVIKTPSSYNLGAWAEPLYPQDHIVRTGRCVRGWIPFEAPKGKKPELVLYQPGAGTVLEWRIK
ncbi:hypothetical protein [Nonomuraea typhae]|uniref:hypothetical protein n=1 Tax=Nonomuraea typhae TaxID=2603600 RepID=UPI0012FA0004|nr:hypothetical protein [Nonomuraea typhae]